MRKRIITKMKGLLGTNKSPNDRKREELMRLGVEVPTEANVQYAQIIPGGMNLIGGWAKVSGKLSLGYASTISNFCQIVGGEISIGKYCQLGPMVSIYCSNHPYDHLTSYLGKNLFNKELKKNQAFKNVDIGNDVWIGHGTVILGGVKIGDGAVIGALSVVNKDVEAYSIYGGSPAKFLKKRFSDEIISLLETLRWWDLNTEEMEKIKDLFFFDFNKDHNYTVEHLTEACRRLNKII